MPGTVLAGRCVLTRDSWDRGIGAKYVETTGKLTSEGSDEKER